MRIVYLFRHGAVEEKYRKRFRGILDYPLSEEGKRMSMANADFLVKEGIDFVITTGRIRTDFVGDYLAKHRIPHEKDERFREIHFGLWEGKTWEEIEREFPEECTMYERDLDQLRFPKGESAEEVQARVVAAWNDLLRREFKKAAVIGHATSNACLLAHIYGISLNEMRSQTTGEMTEIRIADPCGADAGSPVSRT
jgi:broad specificity phosphatase PhoE